MPHRVVSFALACLGAGVVLTGPAAAADPPEVSTLVQRARLWAARDRPDLAHEALDRLSRVAPGHPGGLAVKAELELRSGAVDAARATLEQLRRVDPRHPEIERIETLLRIDGPDKAKLREARLLAKSGRTAQAISALRSLYPKGPPAGELALEYWQLIGSSSEGWSEAQAGLAGLSRLDPEDLRYRFALAEHELARAPLNMKALRQVIELARRPEFSRQGRAAWRRALMRLEAEPDAAKLLQDYLAVEPGDTAVHEKLAAVRAGAEERRRLAGDPAFQAGQQGLALLDRGELVSAEPLLERAVAGRPNDADIVGGMGLLRLRQGRHAEAQTFFVRARQLGAGNTSKWRSLEQTARVWSSIRASGEALDQGNAALAERQALDALRITPNHPDATLALARAQARQGLHAPAEKGFRTVLSAEPLNPSAFRGLVALLAEHRGQAAVDTLLDGLTAGQRNAFAEVIVDLRTAALRTEAERLAAAGRADDASRALESAARLAPDDAWLHYSLARAHADRGAPEQGRTLLGELLKKNPNDAAALHANALFLARLDDDEAALATLLRIAAPQRSEAVLRLEQRLEVQRRSKRARALVQQGDRAAATALLIEAEALVQGDIDAAPSVARGWIELGDPARAGRLLDRLESSAGSDNATALAGLRSSVLQANASSLIADQQPGQAAQLLERALALTPGDPWLRFDLAQVLARQGDAARGLELLNVGVNQSPSDPQALHALALYQSQRGEAPAALRTLERIAPEARHGAPLRTQRRLWLQVQVQRAEAAARAGDGAAARALLTQAEAATIGDAALTTSLAAAWIEIGDAGQARRMLSEAGEDAAPAARLRRAALFTQLGDDDGVNVLLDEIGRSTDLGTEQRVTLEELRDTLAIRRAEQLAREGRVDAALALLRARAETTAARPRIVFAQAEVLRETSRYPEALERYRQVLTLDPTFDAARWGMVDAQLRSGETARARGALDALLSADPGDARALQLLAKLERREGNLAASMQALQAAAKAEWAARAAAGPVGGLSRLDSSEPEGKTTPALAAVSASPLAAASEIGRWWPYRPLAQGLDLNNRWLSGALDWRFRSGSQGKSSLDLKELPIEMRSPWRGGQRVLRADVVRLDAGAVNLADAGNARDFGQVLLCQPTCASGSFAQTANGLALNASYENETLRLDIGSTPLGFALRRPVGGMRLKGDLGPLSYSLDVSSRPVTSSLLSYAGARDPRSGTVWGGVQASGATLTLSADQGGALGGWALLAGHRLHGTHVQNNDRQQLMGGAYWRVVNRENRQFSVGVTGVAQSFAHNVGEYSFGHGGYYSPHSHRSISLPLTFSERGARFSYMLRGAVSKSRSQTDSALFYPSDQALQANAEAQAATTGVSPTYAGGPGSGRGHSLAAALEYQWSANLQVGVRLEIERSRDFEPNRALFYARWVLDGAIASPLAMPPKPVLPTSEF
jgi:predicted Zn-dependent protease